MTPKNYTDAKRKGWVIKNIYSRNGTFLSEQLRIDMQPRFYNGGNSVISFWITRTGAKRLGINISGY